MMRQVEEEAKPSEEEELSKKCQKSGLKKNVRFFESTFWGPKTKNHSPKIDDDDDGDDDDSDAADDDVA